jgi:hypothetical protein
MHCLRNSVGRAARSLRTSAGSAVVEFAVVLPLLAVLIVGIYDFSGAFNTKLKMQHASQLGAIVAAAQPTNDLDPANSDPGPASLLPVVTVVFNSLAADGMLPLASPSGSCKPPVAANSHPSLTLNWGYRITGCSSDPADVLLVTINRGVVAGGGATPISVETTVRVHFPYHWRFNSAIQLLFPGPSGYAAVTTLTEDATVHNQD